jgi:ribonuclease E
VVRVETGLQAAFVDYGAERLGFLQIDEINYTSVKPDYQSTEEGRRPRINDLLHRGQELLVQITKEERGTKGAALTTYLSLAGRYMVLMPGSTTRGVSRKAESDSQRKELKKAMSSIDLAEGVGYIVRTAALDQTREELERDYRYLIRLFESIKELELKAKAPALIYKESNLMIRSIRDYFTTDMDEVLIDDPQVFKEAKDFFQMVMPDHINLVKLHQERRPIFSRYQIEEQIETLSRNKVSLPSGGSIVIDPTEALVAIDVNSGKMASEQNVEATATKTNLEAAEEVGRQLRLRDLGGLIVIDFIDMRERKNMRQVENQLKKSLENDKARVSVGRISQFGLLEMSRQRIKAALTDGSYLTCPHCHGAGHLKSPEAQAVALLRKIHASAAKGQVGRIDAQLPLDVAAYLLNNKREELVEMERRYQLQIHLHGNRDFLADQVEIEIQKKEKEKTQPEFVAASVQPLAVEDVSKKVVEADVEVAEVIEKDTVEGEIEAGKKRRRKRRRKPSSTATAGESQATGQNSAGTEETTAEDVTAEATDAAVENTAEQTTDRPAKRPQKRRRSNNRDKKPTTDTAATDIAEEAPPAAAASAVSTEETSTNAQEVAPIRPKRRRGRRKPRAAQSGTQTESAALSPDQEQPVATTRAPGQAAAAPAASPSSPSDPQPTQSRPPRADKTTEAKAAPEEKAVAIEAKAGITEEKPKRRVPSRAKPKSVEAPATVQAQLAGEKPVKKTAAPRAPRKAPVKKVSSTDKVVETNVSADKGSESSAVEKEKPKRTRAVKKKPAEAKPATND